MQKVVALFFVILSLSVFSQEEFSPEHVGAIEGVSCLVEELAGGDGCDEETVVCEEATSDLQYFQNFPYMSCVQAICQGHPNNLMNISVARDEAAVTLSEQLRAEFAPLASDLFDQLKSNATEAKTFLEANPALGAGINQTATVMDLQGEASRMLAPSSPEERLMPKGQFIRNFRQYLPGWTEQLASLNYDLIAKVRERMQQRISASQNHLRILNPDGRRHLLGQLEQRIRALPVAFTQKQNLLNKVFDLQSGHQFDANVTNEFNLSFYAVSTELELLEVLSSDGEALVLQQRIANEAQRIGMASEARIYEELISGGDKQSFTENCVENIAFQAQSFPTRVERLALTDRIQRSKEEMKGKLMASFSRETRQGLGQAIDATQIALPPAREDYIDRMRGLLSEKRGVLRSLSNEEKVSSSMYYSNLTGITLGTDLCKLPFYADDGASALTTPIQTHQGHEGHHHLISMGNHFAEDFENIGEHVFAHELGHVVSKHIQQFASRHSKRALRETKKCLNTNQSGGGIERLLGSLTGDNLANGVKEEEDFADLFAFLALPAPRNPKCGFFNDGLPTSGMMNSLETSDETPHSSDLYRLLHGEVARNGRIPDICRNELRAEGQEFREQNCWNNASANSR